MEGKQKVGVVGGGGSARHGRRTEREAKNTTTIEINKF